MEQDNRQIHVYKEGSSRNIADDINRAGIQKEDIVALFQDNTTGEYVLFFYK